MKDTEISWCDHTFNPWEGCTKVSPGCASCYAETRNKRFLAGKNWGKGAPRLLRSDAYWKEPLKWNSAVLTKESIESFDEIFGQSGTKPQRRPRVFCASLADWLDEEGPIDQLARLLKLIHETPNLDWLLLTKRPENWYSKMQEALWKLEGLEPTEDGDSETDLQTDAGLMVNDWLIGTPPPNVWVGTSVENQKYADERIPRLLEIPARVRFLSCEPLLGLVDLSGGGSHNGSGLCWDKFGKPIHIPHCDYKAVGKEPPNGPGINWVIVGGESGRGARPMNPAWAASLRDQCWAAGVPFHFKQWGEWGSGMTGEHSSLVSSEGIPCETKGKLLCTSTDPNHTHLFMSKVGKKLAGRELYGREWNEFQEGYTQ